MKFPETPEELKAEILESSDKFEEQGDQRIEQLISILSNQKGKLDDELMVEGIVSVFELESRPDTLFRDQEFAGRLLEKLKPKSEKELKVLAKRILKNWDKSIPALPFWFRDNYGIEKVKEALSSIEIRVEEKDNLKTMKYWLKLL